MVIPDAEQGISYGMLAFRAKGKVIVGFVLSCDCCPGGFADLGDRLLCLPFGFRELLG
jgi:hypothetical protein